MATWPKTPAQGLGRSFESDLQMWRSRGAKNGKQIPPEGGGWVGSFKEGRIDFCPQHVCISIDLDFP